MVSDKAIFDRKGLKFIVEKYYFNSARPIAFRIHETLKNTVFSLNQEIFLALMLLLSLSERFIVFRVQDFS